MMPDPIEPNLDSAAHSPTRSPWPGVVAWLVILGAVVLFVVRQMAGASDAEGGPRSHLAQVVSEFQMRYLVGAHDVVSEMGQGEELWEQAKTFNRGSAGQRLRFVAIAGAMAGSKEAQDALTELEQAVQQDDVTLSDDENRIRDILARIYADYSQGLFQAPSVSREEWDFLETRLGWYGKLAHFCRDFRQARAGPNAADDRIPEALEQARTTFFVLFGAVVAGAVLGFLGLIGLAVLFSLAIFGKLKSGVASSQAPAAVYAETFALWISLFLGLLFLSGRLPAEWPFMVGAAGAMMLSLLALAWPVARGVPWRQVRQDIGWTLGRNPLAEPFVGVAAYVMALPLLGLGLIVTIAIMLLRGGNLGGGMGSGDADPSYGAHPVVQYLAHGDFWIRAQIVFLASVVAPVVEETMFRGVLYRHLRDATRRWWWTASFVVSGMVVSFLFAIIHPQGPVAAPLLMGLAFGFTIAREWRGTLIPCIVGHGLNNLLVTMLAIHALG